MLTADTRKEDIAGFKGDDILGPVLPIVHIDDARQYGEDFFAVIDMPLVWLVSPVKPSGNAAHVGNVDGLPCMRWSEFPAASNFHCFQEEASFFCKPNALTRKRLTSSSAALAAL